MSNDHYTGILRDALTIIRDADERGADEVRFEYSGGAGSSCLTVVVLWDREETK
jgi:hypothetical protein